MSDKSNDRITDFIIRYEEVFTRAECRELIEKIDLLFSQKEKDILRV